MAEDEFLIRLLAVEALTDAGFSVIEAEHAAEALIVLQSRHTEIHALFTDIHMPGSMDGLELASHVDRHWPWIKLLVTSGRSQLINRDIPDHGRFLPKPYSPSEMLRQVRELVGA